jgi:hypothetical protein
MEGRRPTKENIGQATAPRTQSRISELSDLLGVRKAARKDKRTRFTALLHHVTVNLLRDSYYALKRDAAPGVDGVSWPEYETDLGEKLVDLHSRIHRGTYRAQPSKRAYIPKADGRQRPLGIAALEDKIVQQAVVMVLNQIYEEDFLGFSYGFRPGRSQHDALDALWVGIMRKKVSWILDADVRGFFDNLSHEWMVKFIEHRIADRRILRLIQKWLRAGTSEEGKWSKTEVGTPQGAVTTPLTQKVTSSLSVGSGIDENRVRIDGCRIWFYVYDRCRAPAMLKRLSGSIVLASCCGRSRNVPRPSPSWRESVRSLLGKPIVTSNMRSN